MRTVETPQIIPPAKGWEQHSLYQVEVSFDKNNVVHRAVFYSGFLHEGQPAGYNQLWSPLYDDAPLTISNAHYLKVLRKLNGVTF